LGLKIRDGGTVQRKACYLAIQNAVPQWTRTRGWTKAMLAFKIQFGDRIPN
jgi:transposase-like protein